jgi:3-phenylpropionate/trans-cinnamate dioxygenase ferredoxin reductase subunit
VAERPTFAVIGGGLAAAKAVETLRGEGFEGRLVVVAEEPLPPYERPPLSKGYLQGGDTFGDARVHDEGFYAEHDIELLGGTRATALDPGGHRIDLSDGSSLAYDQVLIATGAVPRRPPIPGAQDERVRTLRTVPDSDVLRAALGPGAHLVVIGAGWIGSEAAASARGLGADVTVIEQADNPLERVLGAELGAYFGRLHRDHGVRLLTGAGVEAIEDGRRVRLAGGETLEGDLVLLGVGVAPATGLAEAAGLAVDNGIVVDEHLRSATPGVLAAGDVASARHARYGRQVRVEHWDNAIGQGEAAARSMLGSDEPYTRLPYFFTDQYELGMEYVGLHAPEDRLVVRGSLDEDAFQAYWVGGDGRLSAAMHVNDWDAIDPMRALVDAAAAVDLEQLGDAGRPLPEPG